MNKSGENKKYTVFFDFDNTITTYDILDDILQRFAKDEKWMALEEMWKKGKIGSRECLEGQLNSIRVTKSELNKYLSKVRVDAYFVRLIQFLDSKNIKILILSDNFDFILGNILKNNRICRLSFRVSPTNRYKLFSWNSRNCDQTPHMAVYCNRLKVVEDRLLPQFPFTDESCGGCAHCKRWSLVENVAKDTTSIYVGDGRSDICASEVADVVFAKGYLKGYLKKKEKDHIPFDGMRDVHNHFKKIL